MVILTTNTVTTIATIAIITTTAITIATVTTIATIMTTIIHIPPHLTNIAIIADIDQLLPSCLIVSLSCILEKLQLFTKIVFKRLGNYPSKYILLFVHHQCIF
uniref:Uncharacterized protein n=1 Tax=Romanomermis culicivorax TaxID=13658 RepID=A0A915J2K2_ROMCU